MSYVYGTDNNRLQRVNDSVPDQDGTMDTDFDNMTADYIYDRNGNLIADPTAQIYGINWNAKGKIRVIGREGGTQLPTLVFQYDGMGNRVRKVVITKDAMGDMLPCDQWTMTYYIRDAQGNILTTLDRKITPIDGDEAWDELNITQTVMYGSDRLGVRNWQTSQDAHPASLVAKRKFTHAGLDSPTVLLNPEHTGSVITSTAPANYSRHLSKHAQLLAMASR